MIVVIILLLIMNPMEFRLVHNQKENCQCGHITFYSKGNQQRSKCSTRIQISRLICLNLFTVLRVHWHTIYHKYFNRRYILYICTTGFQDKIPPTKSPRPKSPRKKKIASFFCSSLFRSWLASLAVGLRTLVSTGSRSTAFQNCLLHCFSA